MHENDYTYETMETPKKKAPKTKLLIIIFVIVLVVSNLFTYFVGTKIFPSFSSNTIRVDADDTVSIKNINKLLYLYNVLKDDFLWDVDEQELWDGALHGLMEASGDKYTLYMDQEEYAAYQDSMQSSYSGIGCQMTNNEDGNIEITKVFNGSPALAAGLAAGDVVIAADDVDLRGMNVNTAVTYVRGEAGTDVTLVVLRDSKTFTVTITRAKLDIIYSEYSMLEDNIGYIQIYEFESNTYAQFKAGLDDLKSKGMTGLILDLRQNPGGAVNQAIKVVDELLGECEVIYTVDGHGEKEYYYSDKNCIDVPVVVLIDGNSASSSEIVTAALKDNNGATIVGVQSYGKGIMQVLYPLSDGTLYQYTFCEYFAPSGMKIHGIGITPDYVVEQAEEYKYYLVENIPEGKDLQLNKAIEILKTK